MITCGCSNMPSRPTETDDLHVQLIEVSAHVLQNLVPFLDDPHLVTDETLSFRLEIAELY